MTQKFDFAVLDKEKVANPVKSERDFRPLFAPLKDELLKHQKMLEDREQQLLREREAELNIQWEQRIAVMQKAAYEEGYTKGFTTAKGEQDEQNKQLLQAEKNIEAQLPVLKKQLNQLHQQKASDAVILAATMLEKLGVLSPQDALAKVEALLIKQLPQLLEEERLQVFVHVSQIGALQARLDALKQQAGYAGKIAVSASVQLEPGDCRLEWSGGGIISERKNLLRNIEEICKLA